MKRLLHHILTVTVLVATAVCGTTQDKKSIVQPDNEKWQRVSPGMTEAEVIQLLGQPEGGGMKVQEHPELLQGGTTVWTYWTLYPQSKAFPGGVGVHFLVWMKQGKVMTKSDPHEGDFSLDGKPTVPRLALPQDQTRFLRSSSHVIDLRWLPSAGQYPITYDVELDLSAEDEPARPEDWFTQNHTTAEEPYLAVVAGGVQLHRWRVRGRNALGTSEWSKYFYFEIAE